MTTGQPSGASDRVRAIQTALTRSGYDPHGVDGNDGRQTWAAIFSYVAQAQLGAVGLALAAGAIDAFARYQITIGPRAALFIAQAATETGGFRSFVEDLNYSAAGLAKTFPTHGYSANSKSNGAPTALAIAHARHPAPIANHVYGGRYGNGLEATGDGWRFRGRGASELTFRGNYADVGQALGIDLVSNPDLAADPRVSVLIMARYWSVKGLNPYADAGDVLRVSRGINCGDPRSSGTPNDLADREQYSKRARTLLG